MPKIEKVTLEDFEQEFKRGRQVVKKKHARSTLNINYLDIQMSKARLDDFRQYRDEMFLLKRGPYYYILLVKWATELGEFDTEDKARTWAKKYLETDALDGWR